MIPLPGVRSRVEAEREECERLAPWAQRSGESRGRLHAEPEHPYRTRFARDRDRIVHSRAFRRLEYKTQVFVYHEGDHYRNRLTHTLEGSQIARTLARALRANDELAEAVVLAHDLGHTPFGHAGEEILDRLLADEGGFDHNRQTLRIVDWLEYRYPGFRGLNLTEETREGILKHGCHWEHPVPVPQLRESPSLEAQLADLADEIAYVSHDVDDGLRSGLLGLEQLEANPLWARIRAVVEARLGAVPRRVLRAQVGVALIDALATDVVRCTGQRLLEEGLESAEAVRKRKGYVAGFSPDFRGMKADLKKFLYENLYRHPRVLESNARAQEVLGELYRRYREDASRLPAHVVARLAEEGEARATADYIAGMTDRFALAEHARLRGSDASD